MKGRLVLALAHRPLGRLARGRGAMPALAPRTSPAAVRIPDPRLLDVQVIFPTGRPQIFVHEGARQALERRLQQASPCPVALAVNDNCRNMISIARQGGVLRARIHHMFLDAPGNIKDALVRYVIDHDREASAVVGRFIDEKAHRIRASQPVLRPLSTQGEHHDLLPIFHKVNERYFGGQVDALITWGRKQKRPAAARRTIKLGSYSAVERLIRIHPSLDRAWVPRYFVSYVVFHEMLHHVIPSSRGGGRRLLHPPVFRARERLFRDYERALAWESAHIDRLLRS